jgi:hypothetical protein
MNGQDASVPEPFTPEEMAALAQDFEAPAVVTDVSILTIHS